MDMPDVPDPLVPAGGSDDESAKRYGAKPCPICRKPSDRMFHPFCSKRCSDVDLHRWLGGAYAIPLADDELSEVDQGGDSNE